MFSLLLKAKELFKYRHYIDAFLNSLEFTIKEFETATNKFKDNAEELPK